MVRAIVLLTSILSTSALAICNPAIPNNPDPVGAGAVFEFLPHVHRGDDLMQLFFGNTAFSSMFGGL